MQARDVAWKGVAKAFYNAAVRLQSRTLQWLAVLVVAGVAALGAQEANDPAEAAGGVADPASVGAETTAPVDPRLGTAEERLTAALEELQALESAWRAEDKAERAETQSRLEDIAGLEAELAAAERRTPEMDSLYDRINPLVQWSIDQVRLAIDRATRPSDLPAWLDRADEGASTNPFGGAGDDLPSSERIDRLESLLDEVRATGERLHELELELRLADVQRDLDVASRIYRLRLAALRGLTFERRSQVYSFASDASQAIRLEAQVLELVVRLQWFQLQGFVASLALKLRGFFTALLAGRVLVRLLIIALLWRWVQRGRGRFLRRMRRKAEGLEDPQRQRWALRLSDLANAVAPWGVFILAVLSVGWAFDSEVSEIPFLLGVLAIAVTYGIYRLSVDLLVGVAVAGMESTGVEQSDAQRSKLFSAVRWVARAATPVGFVLWLYAYRLGGGVLYSKIRTAGIVLVLVVFLSVILRFREEIRQMFLALRAHGRLADLVRSTAETWTGYLVTPIAFVWLCGRGVVGLFRGVTHSFERTRTASAYLSRRRMIKVAEQRGHAGGSVESLPAELVEALDERLSVEDAELLGGFPDLETARASAATWREGGTGGSLLLAGEEGLGKDAWLQAFLASEGEGTRLVLEDRMLSPAKVRGWLGEHLLGEGGGARNQDELVEAICSGPRRIVTVEGAENLFLATVNGYKALLELGPIIDATRKHVFWLLTIRGLAWNHLRAAGKELAFLRRKFVIEPRSEERIEALIDSRLAAAGYVANYADLMAVEGRKEDEVARNRMGKSTFMNLLWGFSGGNPQIALHFFLRSLEVTPDGALKVWPFAAPQEDDLSEAGDDALFLLAAVMRHNGLNVRQAATTTAYPVGKVEGLFLHLLDIGTVSENEGIYRVTTNWRATVLRVLRRRNILVS